MAESGVSVDLVGWPGQQSPVGVPVGKMFVDGLITGDVGEATLGERLIPEFGFHRGDDRGDAGNGTGSQPPPHLYSRGFSEDPKALEPAARKVQTELEALAANNVTDPARIAQVVRRTVGKWVGETYRRQPMIVPTVIEI